MNSKRNTRPPNESALTGRDADTISGGFTLIELLVVIAIIAILAAILFPVFAQAKMAAKKAVGMSNVKQLTLANLMYANDYDDTFPTGAYVVMNGSVYTYHENALWGYEFDTSNDFFTLDYTQGLVYPYVKSTGPLTVEPGAPDGIAGNFPFDAGATPQSLSIAENWEVIGVSTTDLQDPANTVLLCDDGIYEFNDFGGLFGNQVGVHYPGAVYGPGTGTTGAWGPFTLASYAGKLNVGWCDGHAHVNSLAPVDFDPWLEGGATGYNRANYSKLGFGLLVPPGVTAQTGLLASGMSVINDPHADNYFNVQKVP